jgi:hypothetical protein
MTIEEYEARLQQLAAQFEIFSPHHQARRTGGTIGGGWGFIGGGGRYLVCVSGHARPNGEEGGGGWHR